MSRAADFVGVPANRSDSDDGRYVRAVREAVNSPEAFRTFKRHPDYNRILEHLGAAEGAAYLAIVRAENPGLLGRLEGVRDNDLLGSPRLVDFPGVGLISPTTLRYLKVASDLLGLFGDLDGFRIAEVGIGYGGQCLVLDRLVRARAFHLFDLPPVLALAAKVLEAHVLEAAYHLHTLNQLEVDALDPDLVVSNYAFSELPVPLQRRYVEKVFRRARRGYLTMNHVAGTAPKLGVEDLRPVLPAFRVLEERPLTAPGNYVIVWGCP